MTPQHIGGKLNGSFLPTRQQHVVRHKLARVIYPEARTHTEESRRPYKKILNKKIRKKCLNRTQVDLNTRMSPRW